MDNVFLHIARQLVTDNWAAPPKSVPPNDEYAAMESQRHALNERIEQCISSEDGQNDLWYYVFEYAQAVSLYYFTEGMKTGAQLHCQLHSTPHLDCYPYK